MPKFQLINLYQIFNIRRGRGTGYQHDPSYSERQSACTFPLKINMIPGFTKGMQGLFSLHKSLNIFTVHAGNHCYLDGKKFESHRRICKYINLDNDQSTFWAWISVWVIYQPIYNFSKCGGVLLEHTIFCLIWCYP